MGKTTIRLFPTLKLLLAVTFVATIVACATIRTPTGGPRDKTPPKVIRETPKNQSVNFKGKKIEIEFDEFFKLANAEKEISISPAFDKNPLFKIKKKVLEIDFQDSLQQNTTYTVNFGKAIVDYNEGNVLKNYSYVFSTGSTLDSLSISGKVINALTRKPELETMAILVPANQDTLFTKKRASIFSLTDSAGVFKLNNLRAGTYRLYALKELGGDRIYNSANEEIGFIKDPISLTKNSSGQDMDLFKEIPARFRSITPKIQADGHLTIAFNRQLASPGLKLLDQPELDRRKVAEFNRGGDSVSIWLPETKFDSLNVAILDRGVPIDTVSFKRSKQSAYNTLITTKSNLTTSGLRQNQDLQLIFSTPLSSTIDPSKINILEDSTLVTVKLLKDSTSTRTLKIRYNWRPKKQYIIKVDENAITGINGGKNKVYTDVFIVDPDENYAAMILKVTVPDSLRQTYLVQLLRNDDEVVRTDAVTHATDLEYKGLSPATYMLRVIYDTNTNGKWDTGSLSERKQPEKIWYVTKEIPLRANQDAAETLAIPKDQ